MQGKQRLEMSLRDQPALSGLCHPQEKDRGCRLVGLRWTGDSRSRPNSRHSLSPVPPSPSGPAATPGANLRRINEPQKGGVPEQPTQTLCVVVSTHLHHGHEEPIQGASPCPQKHILDILKTTRKKKNPKK